MSERPENPSDEQLTPQGGWQLPQDTSPWQARTAEATEPTVWRTVKALPDDIEEEPEEQGTWHRPKEEDTTFSLDDEITIGEDVEEVTDAGTVTSTVNVPNPEDLLAEITGMQRSVAPNPEDFELPSPDATTDADAVNMGDTLLVDEEGRTAPGEPVDEEITMAADLDDEPLAMSEYMALASLAEGTRQDDDLSGVNVDDLSPAERALYNIASATQDEMQVRVGDVDTPLDQGDTLDVDVDLTGENQAADYAAQQLAALRGDGGDTGFGQATQDMPAQQQRDYTEEEIQLAAQFRETRRQAAILRQMQDQGQITPNEVQAQLQNYSILDAEGNWWQIGIESNEWYRYNNMTGQWEVAEPPVPLDAGQMNTETGLGEAAPDVLPGSLPYLPDDGINGMTEFSDQTSYDNTQYNQAQQDYSNQYGIGDTPIPNPDQPPVDPNMTQVGQNWDATTATYAEPTLQGINYVDDQSTMPSGAGFDDQATMPSNAQEYMDQSQYDEYGVPRAEPQATGFEIYEDQAPAPTYAELQEQRQSNVLTFVGIGIFVFVLVGLLSVGGFFLYATNEYNTIIASYENQIAALGSADFDFQTATVLAADGTVIAELTGEQGARTIVSIENGDVSPWFVHAVVSSEDQTFYENAGFDQFAIVRAFWQNLTTGDVVQGASTITQQIVRERVLGNNEVTFDRKLTEVLVSLAVAERYSKNEILDIYINEFFYGEQSYGVEAAAQFYFDTSAADLDAAQAATLAGILPSPSNGNPVVSPDNAFTNMRLVLNNMVEVGCLDFQHGQWTEPGVEFCVSEDTLVDTGDGGQTPLFRRNPDGSFGGFLAVQIAQVESRRYEPRQTDIQYPHFVFYVLGELDQAFGRGAYIERGFTVQTTLIPRIQNTAEGALARQVDDLSINGVQTGAVLVTDPRTGAIVAMVGSPDFFDEDIDGQNNNTLSFQQPGSAIKPVVYADALAGNPGDYYTPASILWDVPTNYPLSNGTTYTPVNFDNRNRGPIPVRFALAQSLNIPAVKTYLDFNDQPFTPQSFIEMGNAMGIEFDPDGDGEQQAAFGLATALGSVEISLMDLTQAYGTIANDGVRVEPYAVESITEGDTEVAVPLSIAASEGSQALSAQVAYLLQDILSDNNARSATVNDVPSTFPAQSPIAGSALGLANQLQVAAKTGTNNTENGDPSRLWTVGFTNNYAVGVWIGSLNQGTALSGNITGLTAASPIWNAVMQEALNGVNPGNFDRPGGVQAVNVCRLTGTLSDGDTNCPFVVSELVFNQQPPPPATDGFVATRQIDSWTGLLANEFCSENVIERTFADIADPFAVQWLNGTTRGQQILNQLGLPQNLPSAPQQACQNGQGIPTVRINFPSANSTVSEDVSITGQISTPNNLQRWELLIAPINTENFQSILTQPRTDQVQTAGTVLTEWDSRTVDNGQYTLRLAAFSTVNGGFVNVDVPITVQNVPPTPTPTPTQPPATVAPIISPIPFDLPTATPGS